MDKPFFGSDVIFASYRSTNKNSILVISICDNFVLFHSPFYLVEKGLYEYIVYFFISLVIEHVFNII